MPVGKASMLWPMTDTELLCSMGQSRGFYALLLPCVTTGEASMPFTVAVTGTSNQPQKRVAASPETHATEVLSGTALAATPEGFYACGQGFYALAHD